MMATATVRPPRIKLAIQRVVRVSALEISLLKVAIGIRDGPGQFAMLPGILLGKVTVPAVVSFEVLHKPLGDALCVLRHYSPPFDPILAHPWRRGQFSGGVSPSPSGAASDEVASGASSATAAGAGAPPTVTMAGRMSRFCIV